MIARRGRVALRGSLPIFSVLIAVLMALPANATTVTGPGAKVPVHVATTVLFATGQHLMGNVTPGSPTVSDMLWDANTSRLYIADSSGSIDTVDPAVSSVVHLAYLGVSLTGIGLDTVSGDLFVSEGSADQVAIYNPANGRVLTTVAVGSNPAGFAFDPTLNEMFVADSGSTTLTAMNATTGAVVGTVPAGGGPSFLAYDSVNGRLYVSDAAGCGSLYSSCNLTVVDPATGTVVATISTYNAPSELAVDPRTGVVFLSVSRFGEVWAISPSTSKVLAMTFISTHAYPTSLAFDSTNGLLYVDLQGVGGPITDGIATINGANYSFVSNYSIPGVANSPTHVALDPASQTLFVEVYTGVPLHVIDSFNATADRFVGAGFTLGSQPTELYYDPRYNELYAVDPPQQELVVINASSGVYLGRIAGFGNTTGFGGYGQHDIAGNPATGEVYVGLPGNLTLAFVNGSTHRVDRWLSVTQRPTVLEFDPATGDLWVGNYLGDVTVYAAATGALLATRPLPNVLANASSVITGFAIESARQTVWVAVSASIWSCGVYACHYTTGMRLVSLNETGYTLVPHGNITLTRGATGSNVTGSVVFDPSTRLLYVAENAPGGFHCGFLVVNPVTHSHLTKQYFSWSHDCDMSALEVNPLSGVMYVLATEDSGPSILTLFDPLTNLVTATLYPGSGGQDLQWVGLTRELWVANPDSETLSIVQT